MLTKNIFLKMSLVYMTFQVRQYSENGEKYLGCCPFGFTLIVRTTRSGEYLIWGYVGLFF